MNESTWIEAIDIALDACRQLWPSGTPVFLVEDWNLVLKAAVLDLMVYSGGLLGPAIKQTRSRKLKNPGAYLHVTLAGIAWDLAGKRPPAAEMRTAEERGALRRDLNLQLKRVTIPKDLRAILEAFGGAAREVFRSAPAATGAARERVLFDAGGTAESPDARFGRRSP